MSVAKLSFLGSSWLLAVGLGLWVLFDYQTTPGAVSALSEHWPADSALQRDPDRPTLVMFVHPHCPCSRASLHELLVLATHSGRSVHSIVVFSEPKGLASDGMNGELWKTARSIPDVTCVADAGGLETSLFKARVSGETMLYDADGPLLFHGGITLSRGHEGDNPGRFAIESLLAGEPVAVRDMPVFGCRLLDRDQRKAAPERR
jgi:hypothetical protein